MPKKPNDPMKLQKLTHARMPATVQLVCEVRDELKADIVSVREEVNSVRHEVNSVRHEVNSVRHELKAKINEVKSDIQKVLSSVHRTQTLMEEQRSENRVVLDGLITVNEHQNRIELELQDMQKTIGLLASR